MEVIYLQLTLENKLLLQIAQFRHYDRENLKENSEGLLDWTEILGDLMYNRLGGIAYKVLMDSMPISLNHEIEFLLFQIYEIQKLRTTNNLKVLYDLSDALEQAEIQYAFLKGSILANSIYPIGCRVSKDIDLLVNAKDLTKVGKVLESLGYVQGFYNKESNKIDPASRQEIIYRRLNMGEVVPYQKLVDMPALKVTEVDVNFSLDWVAQGTEGAVKKFLSEPYYYETGNGRTLRSLPPEYFLAYLCVHLYKEAVVINWVEWQRDLLLYKFLDLYAFITDSKINLNWDKFIDLCTQNGIQKECYYALEHAKTFFPILCKDNGLDYALLSIRPDSVDYLHEVIDTVDRNKKYKWDSNIVERFFNMKRVNELSGLQVK